MSSLGSSSHDSVICSFRSAFERLGGKNEWPFGYVVMKMTKKIVPHQKRGQVLRPILEVRLIPSNVDPAIRDLVTVERFACKLVSLLGKADITLISKSQDIPNGDICATLEIQSGTMSWSDLLKKISPNSREDFGLVEKHFLLQ